MSKFRGIFVKKASHLSKCVKGTLKNIKNVVGNFLTCTVGATRVDLKFDVCFVGWKRGWDLKYLKTIFNFNRLPSELFI